MGSSAAGGKGRVHQTPVLPVKVNDVVNPALLRQIYADPGMVKLSRGMVTIRDEAKLKELRDEPPPLK